MRHIRRSTKRKRVTRHSHQVTRQRVGKIAGQQCITGQAILIAGGRHDAVAHGVEDVFGHGSNAGFVIRRSPPATHELTTYQREGEHQHRDDANAAKASGDEAAPGLQIRRWFMQGSRRDGALAGETTLYGLLAIKSQKLGIGMDIAPRYTLPGISSNFPSSMAVM
mgnify:CR=1 FL=1